MKLVEHFNEFLDDTVNLNKTRIDQLEARVEAIKGVVAGSDWKPRLRTFERQGSWVHKTIIKPVDGEAFDADLLAVVDPVSGWDARDYVESLRDVFAQHGTYSDKLKVWDYCITLTYAGDFKLDLAPCVRDRLGLGYEVCNRRLNMFQTSRPVEFTGWLVQRNTWTGSNAFRKATKLLKYLRDIKSTFTCPSILLTTLLGERISVLDSLNREQFADPATALKTITCRLDDWLQMMLLKPTVPNPVLATEDFGALLSNDQYSNFRDRINAYRQWICEAYDEADRDESIGKWRRVLGDEFAKSVDLEASAIGKTAAIALAEWSALSANASDDIVSLLARHGQLAIPPRINRLPYMRRPRWKDQLREGIAVRVTVALYEARGSRFERIVSGLLPLPKNHWIKFSIAAANGLPLSGEFDVFWRVTNTGAEAANARQLRGDFYSSDDGDGRWEHLQYRGLHLVEAFVVRRRDGALVARSAPCYVVVA